MFLRFLYILPYIMRILSCLLFWNICWKKMEYTFQCAKWNQRSCTWILSLTIMFSMKQGDRSPQLQWSKNWTNVDLSSSPIVRCELGIHHCWEIWNNKKKSLTKKFAEQTGMGTIWLLLLFWVENKRTLLKNHSDWCLFLEILEFSRTALYKNWLTNLWPKEEGFLISGQEIPQGNVPLLFIY